MTTTNRYWERTRDVQDGVERHLHHKHEYEAKSGHYVNVKGTGTEDEDVPVIMSHAGFRLKDDENAETFLISGGSDTHMKFAFTVIPRDKQREWKKGRGGIQHPTQPDFAFEFKDGICYVTKGTFAVGRKGMFEVQDDKVYFRVPVVMDKMLTVNEKIKTPNVESGTEKVPDFKDPEPE